MFVALGAVVDFGIFAAHSASERDWSVIASNYDVAFDQFDFFAVEQDELLALLG